MSFTIPRSALLEPQRQSNRSSRAAFQSKLHSAASSQTDCNRPTRHAQRHLAMTFKGIPRLSVKVRPLPPPVNSLRIVAGSTLRRACPLALVANFSSLQARNVGPLCVRMRASLQSRQKMRSSCITSRMTRPDLRRFFLKYHIPIQRKDLQTAVLHCHMVH